MMKLVSSLVVTFAAFTTPATAQDLKQIVPDIDTGTHFKKEVQNAKRTEARDLQKRVARCAVYRNKSLSRKLLANSNPVAIDFAAIKARGEDFLDEIKIESCITRAMKHSTYRMQMRFQYQTLRALFAEEVYLMDNDVPITLDTNAKEEVEGRNYAGLTPRAFGMAKLADCIVFNGLPASDALLRSTIGSDEEDTAIEQLFPALAQCGLGNAKEVALDHSMLRQIVADGLWSRSHYGAQENRTSGQNDA